MRKTTNIKTIISFNSRINKKIAKKYRKIEYINAISKTVERNLMSKKLSMTILEFIQMKDLLNGKQIK